MLKHVEIAINEIGYREKGTNITKYAEFFDTEFPNFYNGKKNGYAWCDIFVDYCFVKAYGVDEAMRLLCQPIKSAGAGCKYSMAYFAHKNRISDSPCVGDQIFFQKDSVIAHTGIVVSVYGGFVETVEGNSSNCVQRRKYLKTAKEIAGYGHPNYAHENYDIEAVALDVIKGKYGNGSIRKQALAKMGIDYKSVQNRVNDILKGNI